MYHRCHLFARLQSAGTWEFVLIYRVPTKGTMECIDIRWKRQSLWAISRISPCARKIGFFSPPFLSLPIPFRSQHQNISSQNTKSGATKSRLVIQSSFRHVRGPKGMHDSGREGFSSRTGDVILCEPGRSSSLAPCIHFGLCSCNKGCWPRMATVPT